MKYTNKLGLPSALVSAIENMSEDYDRGESDITVTQLVDSPRIRTLLIQHADEVTVDVSEMLWATLGSAVHLILERAEEGNDTVRVESRLYVTVDGWKIGGKFDRLVLGKHGTLQDYKTCKAYAVVYGPKPEWVAQLNLLALLAQKNKYTGIEHLENICFVRDWSRNDAERNRDYPQSEIHRMYIPKWPVNKAMAYLKARVALHKEAELGVPHCSDEERWARPSVWAVMKRGRKTSVRNMDNKADAAAMVKSLGGDHYVEHRPGEYVRCRHYCPVREVCSERSGC